MSEETRRLPGALLLSMKLLQADGDSFSLSSRSGSQQTWEQTIGIFRRFSTKKKNRASILLYIY